MFLEPGFGKQRSGWIEVVTGCMFSGKTEELIRRIKRATIARQKVILFKPDTDIRYSTDHVVSHDSNQMTSTVVKRPNEMLDLSADFSVVGIDESQFFDNSLTSIVQQLALDGKRVIIAGLDLDYKGVPFGPMPDLLAVAEYVTKVHAICPHCGNLATHSYRMVNNDNTIMLGEKESYEPRCRKCYSMGNIIDFRTKG